MTTKIPTLAGVPKVKCTACDGTGIAYSSPPLDAIGCGKCGGDGEVPDVCRCPKAGEGAIAVFDNGDGLTRHNKCGKPLYASRDDEELARYARCGGGDQ